MNDKSKTIFPLPTVNGKCLIHVKLNDKNYITDEIPEMEVADYLTHVCENDDPIEMLVSNREAKMDESGRIYSECVFCNDKKYFKGFINVDAVMIGGTTVFVDTPNVKPIDMKEILQKSEMYRESIIENDTLLKRIINWLIKLDMKFSKR